MTKLLEWLGGAVFLVGIWTALLMSPLAENYMHILIPAPVVLVVLFGLYAATVVLWRVFTFNDCKEAADELQKQIQEARSDLTKKGIKFNQ